MPKEPWHPGKSAKLDRVIQLNCGEVRTHASYKTTRTWENFNNQGTKMILLSSKLWLITNNSMSFANGSKSTTRNNLSLCKRSEIYLILEPSKTVTHLMVWKYRFAKYMSKKLMIFGSNSKKGGVPSFSGKRSCLKESEVPTQVLSLLLIYFKLTKPQKFLQQQLQNCSNTTCGMLIKVNFLIYVTKIIVKITLKIKITHVLIMSIFCIRENRKGKLIKSRL